MNYNEGNHTDWAILVKMPEISLCYDDMILMEKSVRMSIPIYFYKKHFIWL